MKPTGVKTKQIAPAGFTLVEILVALVIVAVLASVIVMLSSRSIRKAKRVESLSNIRNYIVADGLYYGDHRQFPKMDGIVPSSITRARLEIVAEYCQLQLPEGPVGTWPKRRNQPRWINDPMARDSGFAEGRTVGGGVYTGYLYVGGIETSDMVANGFATLEHPEHSADSRNMRGGVLWAGILAEFKSGDPRRYECFHYNKFSAYPDFRFHKEEVEGIPVGYSDGSAKWLSSREIKLGGNSKHLQIRHALGNYYY